MEQWLADAVAAAAASEPMPLATIVPVVPGRVLHLDGDYLAYFMAGNDDTDPGTARRNALQRIINFKEMSGSEKCLLHLTATGSSKADRYLIASVKPYQGQRSGAKPKNWESLRDFLEGYDRPVFKPHQWGDREADDGMALMMHTAISRGNWDLAVSCTRDKDMRQYPGQHLGWTDYMLVDVPVGEYQVRDHNDLLYGHAWFWQQCLQGDGVDNIPGLPRYCPMPHKSALIGEKTAEKMLADATCDEEAFQKVVWLYSGHYLDWPEQLAEQMSLLWLRRGADAHCLDFLRHLQLDRTTDNFKDFARGCQSLLQRVRSAKEAVRAIEAQSGAGCASTPAAAG